MYDLGILYENITCTHGTYRELSGLLPPALYTLWSLSALATSFLRGGMSRAVRRLQTVHQERAALNPRRSPPDSFDASAYLRAPAWTGTVGMGMVWGMVERSRTAATEGECAWQCPRPRPRLRSRLHRCGRCGRDSLVINANKGF